MNRPWQRDGQHAPATTDNRLYFRSQLTDVYRSIAYDFQSTRVEMGVGDAFTWPDHRNARRQYLVLRVYEANYTGGAVHFASSARDFALNGSDRTAYGETPSFLSNHNVSRMQESKDLAPGGKNVGGIAFDIPVRRVTYVILWKERQAARWLPVAKVAVGPGHKPIVSPST